MSFQNYLKEENLTRTEGNKGVENLEKVLEHIGYSNTWGGIISNFLIDNPGAIESIYKFIEENYLDDFEDYADTDEDDCEEEEEKHLTQEEIDVLTQTLSPRLQSCYQQAKTEGKTDVIKFMERCLELGYVLEYYRGRNFYYGPSIVVSEPEFYKQQINVLCTTDNLGYKYILYPKVGLSSDVF